MTVNGVSGRIGRPDLRTVNTLRNLLKTVLTAKSQEAKTAAKGLFLKKISKLKLDQDKALKLLLTAGNDIARGIHLNGIVAKEVIPSDLDAAKIVLELFAAVKWQHQALAQQALDILFPKEPTPEPVPDPAPPPVPPAPTPRPDIEEIKPPVEEEKVIILHEAKPLPTLEYLEDRSQELLEMLGGADLCNKTDEANELGDRIYALMQKREEIDPQNLPDALNKANVQLQKYQQIYNRLTLEEKGILTDPAKITFNNNDVILLRLQADELKATCEILEEWEKDLSDEALQNVLGNLINVRVLENLLNEFPDGVISEQQGKENLEETREEATVTPLPVVTPEPQMAFIELARELFISSEKPTERQYDLLLNFFLNELNIEEIKSEVSTQFRIVQSFRSYKDFFEKLLTNLEKKALNNSKISPAALKIQQIINPSEDGPDANG